MCSLGHHDHAEDMAAPNAKPARAPRRHLDGMHSAILASMPRAMRKENRTRIHAQLLAEVSGQVDTRPEPPIQDDFHAQFEMVPLGADQLPDHGVDVAEMILGGDDKQSRRRERSAAFRATGEVSA